MAETPYPTNGNSSDKNRSANHSSSNEKTAVMRNNLHRQECVRQKRRIDDQRRELVRQLSRDEAEMRQLLHELNLDRTAKPATGSQPDSESRAATDTGGKDLADVSSDSVVDPYPITFPCRLNATTDPEHLHKKLCRQKAIEREASTVTSSNAHSANSSPAPNTHAKLCRLPSSRDVLAANASARSSAQDESQLWVGDPQAIGSVRRPLKSPVKLRTGQLSSHNTGEDVSDVTSSTTSMTSLTSGVTLRRSGTSSRNSSRPQSCCGRLSENGAEKEKVAKTWSGDALPQERKSSDQSSVSPFSPTAPFTHLSGGCSGAKWNKGGLPIPKDHLPQINSTSQYSESDSAVDSDRPRLGSDPLSRKKRKPLAHAGRQKSLQEIVLNRSILNYAHQQGFKMSTDRDDSSAKLSPRSVENMKGKLSGSAENLKTKMSSGSAENVKAKLSSGSTESLKSDPSDAQNDADTSRQRKSTPPAPLFKSKSSLDMSSHKDHSSKPKRQFQVSVKGLSRTRHGSLKDRYLKDIQESKDENQNEGGENEEKKKGFRRTKSLKERPGQTQKN